MFRRTLTFSRIPKIQHLSRRWSSTATLRQRTWPTMAALTLTAGVASCYALQPVNYAHAEAPAYKGSVEDEATQLPFPIHLNTNNEWKRLIGLGVRTVTFLKMNVYVIGMYMKKDDIEALKSLEGWKDFEQAAFLETSELAESLLEQPYEISLRLVPARATNTQHLRDGFLRLLMQRMKDQSMTEEEEREALKAMQEFKSNFVSMNVKKNSEFIFTKTKEGGLRMSYEGKDWGTVENAWLAKNFVMSYLEPNAPSSEAALHDIALGFQTLLKGEQ